MWIVLPALLTVHVIVCFFLVLIVMMQRPKSEGLGAAFGSGMTENFFGAQTSNVLQKITVWLGSIFFALSLILAIIYARSESAPSLIDKELKESSKAVPALVAPSASPATGDSSPQASPVANP
ncbi:MAG: preprotein translocase subunit SecG [Chthoniobacterales bacterium]